MEAIEVKIMGREFRVACKKEDQSIFMRAVDIVDTKMNNIRSDGRVIGIDRIAVMAALQIALETLQQQMAQGSPTLGLDSQVLERRINSISESIGQALVGS
jgi:cell division protein ZapA